MALVINSSPKYYSELNDNELVNTSQFQVVTRDGIPLVYNRVWIGLGTVLILWSCVTQFFYLYCRHMLECLTKLSSVNICNWKKMLLVSTNGIVTKFLKNEILFSHWSRRVTFLFKLQILTEGT